MTTPQDPGSDLVATVEQIAEPECWNLLAGAQVGRIGLRVGEEVEVLPVNFTLDGRSILFRTAEDSVLNEASMRTIAFEVDRFEETTHEGWSVLVKGFARDIGDAIGADAERMRRLSLATWAPGPRPRWFQIEPDTVTGRRVRAMPAAL